MLKVLDFSWLWVSWVYFACWFLVFLSWCYFFFFFYSCIIVTIWKTTTIITSSVSEGKGTTKTPAATITTSFCKPKLLISFMRLLSTRWASMHWFTSIFDYMYVYMCALCMFTFTHYAFRLFFFSFFLQVVVNKKVQLKEPFGASWDVKWQKGVDASSKTPKGKGVYQFLKKYGVNVDGYSPIYVPDEWLEINDSYARVPGLAIWATFLGSLLLGGASLVYNTNALVSYILSDL